MTDHLSRFTKKQRIEWKNTFEVRVGAPPNDHVYTVYSDPLTQRLTFFQAATSKKWKKDDAPVDLSDHETEVFECYLDCVYRKELQVANVTNEEGHAPKIANLSRLLNLYILADRLGDLVTANYVIDILIRASDICCDVPDSETASRAFEAVPESSPLRRLLVDWFVRDAVEEASGLRLSHGLLAAVFAEFSSLRRTIQGGDGDVPADDMFDKVSVAMGGDKCRYHQHNGDHPKCDEPADTSDEDDDEGED